MPAGLPHLDLEPLAESERPLLKDVLNAPWIRADQEQRAIALAATTLVPEHFREVAERRVAHVDKTLSAVHDRLSKEIAFWSDRWLKLKDDLAAGKDVRLNVENARRTVTDLEGRLGEPEEGTPVDAARRQRHADRPRRCPCRSGGPACGSSVATKRPLPTSPPTRLPAAASSGSRWRPCGKPRKSRGCHVVDVSKDKCGWDLTSHPPAIDQKQPDPRHIEVKGRVKGAATVTVTRNEMLYAFNQGDKFVLAIVLVAEDDSVEGPYYIRRPFDREPGWGVSSINYNLSDLLQKAEAR